MSALSWVTIPSPAKPPTVYTVPRLYCGYGVNTTATPLTQNVWTRFSFPSTGIATYRSHLWEVSPSIVRFTYSGAEAKWFHISAVCNVLQATGNGTRTLQFQWRLDGNPIGTVRQTYMTTDDSQIICGEGDLLINPGQYLEPWVVNIENSNDVLLLNCSFNIKEDPDTILVSS